MITNSRYRERMMATMFQDTEKDNDNTVLIRPTAYMKTGFASISDILLAFTAIESTNKTHLLWYK